MKLWHIAAIAAVLGIAYVLISRPKVPNPGASPYTSNAPYIGLIKPVASSHAAYYETLGRIF